MRELMHPVTRDVYGVDPETGFVRVEQGAKIGLFDWTGIWHGGDKFQVDPEFCNWLGGAGANGNYSVNWKG